MNKQNGQHSDLFADGFHQLDDHLIEPNPPKISWGIKYKDLPAEDKIIYLQKLASTMNHAAYLIQNERNTFGKLCEKKERQLISQQETIRQNTATLQTEIEKMNALRHKYNQEIARLNDRIRELEDAHNN